MEGAKDLATTNATPLMKQVEWVRQDAGARFDALELHLLVYEVTVTEDRIQAAQQLAAVMQTLPPSIRHSLSYVTWTDQKAFMKDLRTVYQAGTREQAETNLLQFGEKWGAKYPAAIRSWEHNWADLSTSFDYPAEIRRLIYTTNALEAYHRQLRKVRLRAWVTRSASFSPTKMR